MARDNGTGYCRTCRYWHAADGECRCRCPEFSKSRRRQYPHTGPYCWCGDFKKRREGYIDGVPAREYWRRNR